MLLDEEDHLFGEGHLTEPFSTPFWGERVSIYEKKKGVA